MIHNEPLHLIINQRTRLGFRLTAKCDLRPTCGALCACDVPIWFLVLVLMLLSVTMALPSPLPSRRSKVARPVTVRSALAVASPA
jgi:hypothetical protein